MITVTNSMWIFSLSLPKKKPLRRHFKFFFGQRLWKFCLYVISFSTPMIVFFRHNFEGFSDDHRHEFHVNLLLVITPKKSHTSTSPSTTARGNASPSRSWKMYPFSLFLVPEVTWTSTWHPFGHSTVTQLTCDKLHSLHPRPPASWCDATERKRRQTNGRNVVAH